MISRQVTESPIEVMMLAALYRAIGRREGFAVATQREVVTPSGLFRLDIAVEYQGRRLAVECDGHAYHSAPEQKAKDAARDLALASSGWPVLRFTGAEILKNAESCATRVLAEMAGEERAAGPGATVRVVLPGAAVDALALLAIYPSLAWVAEEENLSGLVPAGQIADLARDAMRDPVGLDEFVSRLSVVCAPEAVSRVVEMIQGERPDSATAELWIRKACAKAALELAVAEQDRQHTVIASTGSPLPEEMLVKAQVLSRRRADLERRLRHMEAA